MKLDASVQVSLEGDANVTHRSLGEKEEYTSAGRRSYECCNFTLKGDLMQRICLLNISRYSFSVHSTENFSFFGRFFETERKQ